MSKSAKYHFQCINCNKTLQSAVIQYLCPKCETENNTENPPKGVLKTIYHYDEILLRIKSFKELKTRKYIDILPVNSTESMGYLQVGGTPLYRINHINNEHFNFDLFLKDDSQNPSFSFKDRASIIVSAYAKENQIATIAAASTGNAGSSLASICASQHQKSVIFVPASAPLAKLTQIVMYGAVIVPVKGDYDMAFDLSIAASRHFGWYNRNTAYNPFTIEGKKTVSFELFDQLHEQIPDRVFVPVGDGVIIAGVYKGFEDLLKLGFIDKIPVIVAVQSDKSQNLIANLNNEVWKTTTATTIADSISVNIPRNFYMAQKYLQQYKGEHITVSDDEIIEASVLLSRNTGIFSEPAAAAAFAAMLKYKDLQKLDTSSKNVVLLTGSGLKDLKSVSDKILIPKPINPDIESVLNFLNNL